MHSTSVLHYRLQLLHDLFIAKLSNDHFLSLIIVVVSVDVSLLIL